MLKSIASLNFAPFPLYDMLLMKSSIIQEPRPTWVIKHGFNFKHPIRVRVSERPYVCKAHKICKDFSPICVRHKHLETYTAQAQWAIK